MEYNRKLFHLILLLINVLYCVGCSSITDYIVTNQDEAFDATVAKHDAIMGDIEQHIGKHKNELKMMLGSPSEVISPSLRSDVEYDEEWIYEQGIGFASKQYRIFYIKNDIVVHVEFGGVF